MKKYTLILIILLIPFRLWAECTVDGLSYTAESASQAHVKVCTDLIDTNSAYGATLNIPACAQGSCVWEDGIIITKNIRIVGAGKTVTILTNGQSSEILYKYYFKFVPDATAIANIDSLSDTGIFEVSNIHFYDSEQHVYVYPVWIEAAQANPVGGTVPIKRVRIHHNKFTNTTIATKVRGYVHGLFDNNELINSGAHYSEGFGVNHWTYDIRHIGTAEAWYVEDNTFAGLSTANLTLGGASNNGFSQVIRYNTVTDAVNNYQPWETHTPAPQFTEVYGNKLLTTAASQLQPQIRGGMGLVFFNQHESGEAVLFREEYSDYVYYSGGWSTALPPIAGECAYATAYDPREGTSPQICNDSVDTGTDCTCKKVNHSYVWNNRKAAGTLTPANKSTDAWQTDEGKNNTGGTATLPELVEDREYFNHTASFDGTTGMGCGTESEMKAITPTLTNAGFWVTAQDNCASLTGYVGVASDRATTTTKIEGTLYRWNGSAWVSWYTPYTYPHPLRGEGGSGGSGHSFSGGASHSFGSGSTITWQ